jgi:hypothetical protein
MSWIFFRCHCCFLSCRLWVWKHLFCCSKQLFRVITMANYLTSFPFSGTSKNWTTLRWQSEPIVHIGRVAIFSIRKLSIFSFARIASSFVGQFYVCLLTNPCYLKKPSIYKILEVLKWSEFIAMKNLPELCSKGVTKLDCCMCWLVKTEKNENIVTSCFSSDVS